MKYILVLFLFCTSIYAQKTQFEEGDLIFQNLNCGVLCDAINEVTHGYEDMNFNHIGMVTIQDGIPQVIEATHPAVCITPLDSFLAKSTNPMYLGRVKQPFTKLIPKAIEFAKQQIGIEYDENYLYQNGKYYCSELIFEAFKAANKGKSFFYLYPMTYKSKYTGEYFPVWVEYFERLNQPIPEGAPGCNPAGISLSNKITIVEKIEF